MRITGMTTMSRWMVDNQNRLSTIDSYNRQIGSGKEMDRPADDPTGANRVVQLDEIIARNDQYLANIDEAIHLNSTTESVMDQVFDQLIRVKELSVEAANAASLPSFGGFQSYVEEIGGIRDAIADLSRSQVNGAYLFNGTAGEVAPYPRGGGDYQGDSNMLSINMGNGTSVPLNLPGDFAFREPEMRGDLELFNPDTPTINIATPLEFVISDGRGIDTTVTLSGVYDATTLPAAINAEIALTGANLQATVANGKLSIEFAQDNLGGEMAVRTVTGDLNATLGIPNGTKNVFSMLNDLISTMNGGDLEEVSEFLDRIDRMGNNVADQRGKYGARARNLQFARERIEMNNMNSETLKENISGIDLTQVVMRMTAGEQAYQASLAAGAKIFNISILNFLR